MGSVVSDDGESLFRFKHVQSIQMRTAHDFSQWKKHVGFFVVLMMPQQFEGVQNGSNWVVVSGIEQAW